MSKGITVLAQTRIFNNNIREWRRQSSELKTWAKYKLFFHRKHREKKIAVTNAGKLRYTATVQNIYGESLSSPEEHYEVFDDIQTIVQVM